MRAGPAIVTEDDLPFRQLAQHLPTPCWISDSEGQIIWVNDAWIAYTGADVGAVQGVGLKALHDPTVFPQILRRWQTVKARGVADESVFPLRGKDGVLRPFQTRVVPLRDHMGRITRWFGTNTDISAQSETEARLRSSDEQLREIFERAGDAIFIVDADRRLVDVNAAACAMTQFTKDELLAMPVSDLAVPRDEIAQGGAPDGDARVREWAVRRKDGSLLEVEVSTRGLSDGRRIGVARDISARKQAEQRLAARAGDAERQLRRFWDASRDLFTIVSTIDGKPRLINERAWRETLGYTAAQITAMRLIDLIHPDDQEGTLALSKRQFDRDEYFGFENRYRHKDGGWVWLSWNVVREGELSYCIARDITEEKATQETLARSERQFRLLVASVVDYALFMLSPDGIITHWNAGAQRIQGYTAEEVVGKHLSIFYTDSDRADGRPATALRTAAEQGRFEAEGWRVRKDGTQFWANVVIDAIRDEGGDLVGFAKITRDITERRNAQLELQRANERLAHAQKMEAIGQLTGGVAHDFNNLLMVVGGQAQMLRSRVGEDPRVTRALDAIELAARRGRDLTRHLLSFARRQRLNPAPVSLTSLAPGLRALIASSIGPNVSIAIDCPPEVWTVEVDVSELELSILNLAVNARDAMPAGGALSIAARNLTLRPGDVEPDLHGDFVELTVSDTGVGIPADILPKVTDPFFTTKDVNKGTGLGLSQVYGFAQQSGGRLAIQSELGRGTSITLYLPRAGSQPAPAVEAAPTLVARDLDILCVEDNPEVANVAADLLEHLGHRVRMANSASAALEMLEQNEPPDLVFSDVVMAGEMDGLALARHIRRHWPALPVLLATGYSQATAAIGGEFPILAKPYQMAELNDALGAALAAKH